jgi:hypothetical protein
MDQAELASHFAFPGAKCHASRPTLHDHEKNSPIRRHRCAKFHSPPALILGGRMGIDDHSGCRVKAFDMFDIKQVKPGSLNKLINQKI